MTVQIEIRPIVTGLPTHMHVEYFGKLQDGREFVIYRPRENWEYKDFRCLVERGTAFILCELLDVQRYRDGGTTDIKIEAGIFHFPSPFRKEPPTFNGEPLTLYGERARRSAPAREEGEK